MKSSTKVLFVAYEFPPAGGIEVQRIIKFVKYIRKFNVEPVVLTTSHGLSRFMDYDLLDLEYIKKTNVIRLGGSATCKYHEFKNEKGHTKNKNIYYLGLKYIWFLDIYSSWFFEIKNSLERILSEQNIKCVYTTSPPASTHLIGEYITKNYNVPWVMDIRDSMADNPNLKRTVLTNMQNKIAAYYENRFCKHADQIVTVSQPIIENMTMRVRDNIEGKANVIMNGYDLDDFDNYSSSQKETGYLNITYTGSFLGEITPIYFIKAIQKLILDQKIAKGDIKLTFVGKMSDQVQQQFNNIKGEIEVDLVGPVSHEKAISYQQQADLLLLILAPKTDRYAAEVISGKIFEYMVARKPVLGLIPEGPLMGIFESTKIGFSAKPNDLDEISNCLLTIFRQWETGEIEYHPVHKEISKYTREKQAEQLASVINGLV